MINVISVKVLITLFLGAAMFNAYTHDASAKTTTQAVWHNKIPTALAEPAADIDKDPNLLHKYADHEGTKIHYVTLGARDRPLMVFVHGFPDFWYSWRNQIKFFSANYQVVALDLRGYNLSGRPEWVDQYKIPVLLGDIGAVIKAESHGRKIILIGHDWGAALSWLFAGQNPDLIERLVILSVPHPGAITKELLPWNHPAAQMKASAYATRFFAKGKGDGLTAEELAYWILNPEIKNRYIEAFNRSNILSITNYYRANYSLSQFALNVVDPTMRKIYGAMIKCPVLHLQGSEETHALLSTPELEKAWMEDPKNLTVKILPGVGHFIQHEEPDALNQTIASWLKHLVI